MSSEISYQNALKNRLESFSKKQDSELALETHIPFQVAVVSNLLSISRDPIVRNLTDCDTRELRILINIGSYGPITASDIAYQTRLDPYSTTRAINALIKKDLAQYAQINPNTRSKPVELTNEGVDIYSKITEHLKQREERLLESFTEKEKATLSTLLQKLELSAESVLANEVKQCELEGDSVTRDHKEIVRWYNRTNKQT
ncbi:MarR family winged helix-turn-helix transcriptional regulator [Pseudoalteromonas umbrosa]|uniref:MarR family winged helix-turn-helix transcriptional regulator n=1 Tax=Pseudoalteromonas umbrosa TaxID=3048489 RepID=UPI0024C227AA|nr:MarR family transcriptional regulator [Pseudoalteromonas sp. B95]MDK1288032.1 MarR family transcriptional regulator [Pseudoalteromonas sp. B95]